MDLSNFLEWLPGGTSEKLGTETAMLRLDKMHPIVSGNKYFKLKYHLQEAIEKGQRTIVSFGGPYSNHLHAAAYTAKEKGLLSIGYVRGFPPKAMNRTLEDCIKFGMQLNFISPLKFNALEKNIISDPPKNVHVIPMGGYGENGYKGAGEILSFDKAKEFDYIIAVAGTGTMAAGLLSRLHKDQQLIIVSAVGNNFSLLDEIMQLDSNLKSNKDQLKIFFDFHFGGFAKFDATLINEMNKFYVKHNIPTDFVYTGKLIYAFQKLLEANYFKAGKKILLIHSGGLQGNRSLKNGLLHFSNLD